MIGKDILLINLLGKGCQGDPLPRENDEAHDNNPLIPRGRIDVEALDRRITSNPEFGGIFNVFSEDLAYEIAGYISKNYKGISVSMDFPNTPDGCIYVGYLSRKSYNKLLRIKK